MVIPLGHSIPANTPHAISVSLPTWKDIVGYEEGDPRVVNSMKCGYPRFFFHPDVRSLFQVCLERHHPPRSSVTSEQDCLVFPSERAAKECRKFINQHFDTSTAPIPIHPKNQYIRIASIQLVHSSDITLPANTPLTFQLSVVFFPKVCASVAKQYWQHTGEGISSRFASYCLTIINNASINANPLSARKSNENPRYHISGNAIKSIHSPAYGQISSNNSDESISKTSSKEDEDVELETYLEERFGRNLDFSLAWEAKIAVRRRIAGCLDEGVVIENLEDDNLREVIAKNPIGCDSNNTKHGLTENDVYLFPCGMSAIYNAFRLVRYLKPDNLQKTIQFGFPYTDTLKIQEKFNPNGAIFLSSGDSKAMDELGEILENKNGGISAVFCEIPSNPLLKTPNLKELSKLAKKFDFILVVDDTIGNFLNIDAVDYADVVVSSLTKIFSGDSNVMAGSLVTSPKSRLYKDIRNALNVIYEDNLWLEDAIFLERNSRSFKTRNNIINSNTEIICDYLIKQPIIKSLFYPKFTDADIYLLHSLPNESTGKPGFGGLFSVVFEKKSSAIAFYDKLDVFKGPSLGTSFTLASPYTVLAHYVELEWAAEHGVPENLVRISIGIEDIEHLKTIFQTAIAAAEKSTQ